jgi:hypothetical protein
VKGLIWSMYEYVLGMMEAVNIVLISAFHSAVYFCWRRDSGGVEMREFFQLFDIKVKIFVIFLSHFIIIHLRQSSHLRLSTE